MAVDFSVKVEELKDSCNRDETQKVFYVSDSNNQAFWSQSIAPKCQRD